MRLRNKKTSEAIDLDIANIKAQFGGISVIPEPVKLGGDEYVYYSLAELNKDWEDYVEPLIKDEKIRKAVRAWAELAPSAQVRYDHSDGRFYTHSDYIQSYSISFPIILGLDEMTDYTIAELCGEEEDD